jgi:amyloid beta A4 protein
MAAARPLLTLFVIGLAFANSAHIEGVSATVDSDFPRSHQPFIPLVAFNCGYRNQYMKENGEWHSDDSKLATCLQGKYDILKYCKRVYPGHNITNIVEYSHEVNVEKWCKEDGTQCKHSIVVRPFQCIVGEFVTESLQVPGQCHFSHIIGRNTCNDYKYWNTKAEGECSLKVIDGEQMALRSFAILEPCGLDMFRGVEFVCCPKNKGKIALAMFFYKNIKIVGALGTDNTNPIKITAENKKDDEDEDDDEDDDEESEEDPKDKEKNDENDELAKLDPYFKEDDTASEHERFKEAEERLEKKHRKKVTKVITEWSELFERYNKMKENDPKGAEEYKREMTARFRKTVASLEEENKEQRQQIEEVHDQRVQALLNEKKRQATHEYRSALAVQVGTQNKQNVLRSLKNYIRTEEKDRTHMLNRYRHLLRSDQEEAQAFEPILLHRLRYIDLRINGTLAMLRDFPELEKQIRPIAGEFWQEFRRENTPEVNDDELTMLGNEEANEKLIALYKKTYERTASLSDKILVDPKTTTIAPPKPTTPKKIVSLDAILSGKRLEQDSDEDENEDDEDSEEIIPPKKINIHIEPIQDSKKEDIVKPAPDHKPIKEDTKKEDDEEYDDYDHEDDSSDDESSNKKELHVVVEPIVGRPVRIQEEVPEGTAYAKHEKLVNEMHNDDFETMNAVANGSNMMIIMALVSALTVTTILITILRRRVRHPGFIEVDVCTPEDRHVAGMQVNGYENPTYSFFDGNKP